MFVFRGVMMVPRVVLGLQRTGDGGADAEGRVPAVTTSSAIHPGHREVPRDELGVGSRVSPACGHLCIRVTSWDTGTGEVCVRALGFLWAVVLFSASPAGHGNPTELVLW